jgi:hypothetical protein
LLLNKSEANDSIVRSDKKFNFQLKFPFKSRPNIKTATPSSVLRNSKLFLNPQEINWLQNMKKLTPNGKLRWKKTSIWPAKSEPHGRKSPQKQMRFIKVSEE